MLILTKNLTYGVLGIKDRPKKNVILRELTKRYEKFQCDEPTRLPATPFQMAMGGSFHLEDCEGQCQEGEVQPRPPFDC